MEMHYHLLETVPGYRERRIAIEQFTARHALFGGSQRAGLAHIPIVVHVVYNTAEQNIDDAQVASQIDALNRDYQAANDQSTVPDPFKGVIGNPRIAFALATTDPSGNPTNGITRTATAATSFAQAGNPVKSSATGGADPWPSDRYLNIWTCRLGDGLLGYATFPGGPPEIDGVVILYSAFGTTGTATSPYNLGRTAVHEVGHWLNLIHIWGDTDDCSGSDLVDDTPTQQTPNYNKPVFPHVSCSNAPNGDMFMNYMDYVDDDVMVMFTQGQVARIDAAIGARGTVVH